MRRLCSEATTCARAWTIVVQPFISSRTTSSRSCASCHTVRACSVRAARTARRRSPPWKIGTESCTKASPSSSVEPVRLGEWGRHDAPTPTLSRGLYSERTARTPAAARSPARRAALRSARRSSTSSAATRAGSGSVSRMLCASRACCSPAAPRSRLKLWRATARLRSAVSSS